MRKKVAVETGVIRRTHKTQTNNKSPVQSTRINTLKKCKKKKKLRTLLTKKMTLC